MFICPIGTLSCDVMTWKHYRLFRPFVRGDHSLMQLYRAQSWSTLRLLQNLWRKFSWARKNKKHSESTDLSQSLVYSTAQEVSKGARNSLFTPQTHTIQDLDDDPHLLHDHSISDQFNSSVSSDTLVPIQKYFTHIHTSNDRKNIKKNYKTRN